MDTAPPLYLFRTVASVSTAIFERYKNGTPGCTKSCPKSHTFYQVREKLFIFLSSIFLIVAAVRFVNITTKRSARRVLHKLGGTAEGCNSEELPGT